MSHWMALISVVPSDAPTGPKPHSGSHPASRGRREHSSAEIPLRSGTVAASGAGAVRVGADATTVGRNVVACRRDIEIPGRSGVRSEWDRARGSVFSGIPVGRSPHGVLDSGRHTRIRSGGESISHRSRGAADAVARTVCIGRVGREVAVRRRAPFLYDSAMLRYALSGRSESGRCGDRGRRVCGRGHRSVRVPRGPVSEGNSTYCQTHCGAKLFKDTVCGVTGRARQVCSHRYSTTRQRPVMIREYFRSHGRVRLRALAQESIANLGGCS